MDPFHVVKNSWQPGDTREVEASRIEKQVGMEYDSYRRVYIADGHEWQIVGKIAKEGGQTVYILECITAFGELDAM